MGKSHFQRQKEYTECLKKKNPEMYLKQDWDRKKNPTRSFEENYKMWELQSKR